MSGRRQEPLVSCSEGPPHLWGAVPTHLQPWCHRRTHARQAQREGRSTKHLSSLCRAVRAMPAQDGLRRCRRAGGRGDVWHPARAGSAGSPASGARAAAASQAAPKGGGVRQGSSHVPVRKHGAACSLPELWNRSRVHTGRSTDAAGHSQNEQAGQRRGGDTGDAPVQPHGSAVWGKAKGWTGHSRKGVPRPRSGRGVQARELQEMQAGAAAAREPLAAPPLGMCPRAVGARHRKQAQERAPPPWREPNRRSPRRAPRKGGDAGTRAGGRAGAVRPVTTRVHKVNLRGVAGTGASGGRVRGGSRGFCQLWRPGQGSRDHACFSQSGPGGSGSEAPLMHRQRPLAVCFCGLSRERESGQGSPPLSRALPHQDSPF